MISIKKFLLITLKCFLLIVCFIIFAFTFWVSLGTGAKEVGILPIGICFILSVITLTFIIYLTENFKEVKFARFEDLKISFGAALFCNTLFLGCGLAINSFEIIYEDGMDPLRLALAILGIVIVVVDIYLLLHKLIKSSKSEN